MNPKISIIVPVYNVEKYLNKCLNSLINQTFKDIEIILINDGSTDNSEKIIKEYMKKDKRIILLSKENGGQGSARNVGIRNSKGEFIMFVDSDDYVDLSICEKLYNNSIMNNSEIVFCNYTMVNENYEIIQNVSKSVTKQDIIKQFMINESGPCCKIIKAEILKKNELYFPIIKAYEDIGIVPAWALFASKISFVNENLYYYLIRQGSTMNQVKYNEKLTHIFSSLNNLKKYFDCNEKYVEEIEWIYIDHLLHAASLRFLKFGDYKSLDEIVNIFKNSFPNWKKNKYYKLKSKKYKIVCTLIYYKKYKLLNLLLKESD